MANPTSSYLAWATDPNADVVQPSPALVASGFVAGQRPAASTFNALFQEISTQLRGLAEGAYGTAMSAALEPGMRLIGGGTWSWNNTTGVLAWSNAFNLSVPGLPDAQNSVAAGSITLAQNQCALITNANVPFTASADTSGGTYELSNLSFTAGIVVGMAASGGSIPSGATVTAVQGNTVTLSQAPTQSAAQISVTFVGTSQLKVQAVTTSSIAATATTVVFARRVDSDVSTCFVGVNSGQMALRDGEQKTLMGPGFTASTRLTAATAIAQRQAVYANVSTGQVGPCDASNGAQANLSAFVGFAESAAAQGAYTHVVSAGVLGGFTGLVPSAIYYVDPTNVGGITNGKPASSGQAIVPVGVALSTSLLLINPAAGVLAQNVSNNLEVKGNLQVDGTSTFVGAIAGPVVNGTGQPITITSSVNSPSGYGASLTFPYIYGQTASLSGAVQGGSFVSAAGLKRTIFLGGYSTTNFPGASAPLVANYSGGDVQRRSTQAFAGSVLAVTAAFNGGLSASIVTALQIYKNGTLWFTANLTPNSATGSYTGGSAKFAKGTYAFVAGDVISCFVNYSQSGVNISIQAEATLESDG